MGYKDEDINREYKKEWAFRKRKGLPTAVKGIIYPKLTDEERIIRKRIWDKKARNKILIKRKEIKTKYLGKECYFCKNSKNKKLTAHKKDGKSHKDFNFLNKEDYEREMSSGKYVLLCYICHKSVHWCMEFLNLDWENIIKLRK